MTRLAQEIVNDPEAVFEIEMQLPSGNMAKGTIGPLIGGRLQVAINLGYQASSDDIEHATRALDQLLGQDHQFKQVTNSPEEREDAMKNMRKFMGGGKG